MFTQGRVLHLAKIAHVHMRSQMRALAQPAERSHLHMLFQHSLFQRLPEILANEGLVERVLSLYVPMILQEKLGLPFIRATLGTAELSVYRDAIITKKLASMAFYRYGLQWQSYLEEVEKEPIAALLKAVE